MHIGFDISQTGSNKAGCGYFAHAMIQAMLQIDSINTYSLFLSFGDFYYDSLMYTLKPYSGNNVRYGPRHASLDSARTFWNLPDIETMLGKPDIIHANNFWCPMPTTSSRLIYTFYDMSFAINPMWTTETNRVGCFDGVFRSSISADWVVAISEASRVHYLKTFPHFPDNRIKVIYPCSRFSEFYAEGKKPKSIKDLAAGGYWLSVGTIEPRKNQVRLAQAYKRYRVLGGAPMPLVIAGGQGWLMEDFTTQLRELGIAADVIMTGYVSDEELIWLYRNCYANLYSSLFEGFGLPVLEGMQFGAPTIASCSTSIPEITGTAAILLPPEDTESWAQAMRRLATNLGERDGLSALAREQAKKFDWKHSASVLLQLYQNAVNSPKRQMPV